jgi:hypothetical protein
MARKAMKTRTHKRSREPEQPDGHHVRDMPWLQAIETVLRAADRAMSPPEIADEVAELGLRQNVGATPAQTVWANLSASVRKPRSPFVRPA